MKRNDALIWIPLIILGVILAVAFLIERDQWSLLHWRPGAVALQGATIRRDLDPRRQLPISEVTITASDGKTSIVSQSDDSGYFRIGIPGIAWPGRTITLTFRHPDYEPLRIEVQTAFPVVSKELYVAAMTPIVPESETSAGLPHSVVSNIRVRYTVNSHTEQNIGSAVRTFQVVHHGTLPCKGHSTCSPGGEWEAAAGSITLDAGEGNEFRNARASCIAGPCPFTQIDPSRFANGGRTITASALDWSDTATFLLAAEVFRSSSTSNVHELYPVVFGRTLNFTLPPIQEGVSLEADIDDTPMVFPLGPELYLSWATCSTRSNAQQSESATVYRCELKPGYRF